MLLEFVTCAFAVFGTLSCDDGGNADAGEKFQELVLAYEEVLETKGDRKLRGLKDIHQQLDEIATRYPDADVTAKILSSNIVGINLSRVERAIQKLDPDFNKQTETIVVGDVSSSHAVMEAPYNDLIVQMASVPHMPKNLPIEVKAAPQKEVLVVSTKQQPPITLPTAKPKRETPVVVADIPLPIAKPEVQSGKQPVKQLASSMPKTADWNMLVVPTAFSGGSSFKPSSTWNNLGPQRSLAAIVPNQVIVAQVETDALDDEKVVNEDRKAEIRNFQPDWDGAYAGLSAGYGSGVSDEVKVSDTTSYSDSGSLFLGSTDFYAGISHAYMNNSYDWNNGSGWRTFDRVGHMEGIFLGSNKHFKKYFLSAELSYENGSLNSRTHRGNQARSLVDATIGVGKTFGNFQPSIFWGRFEGITRAKNDALNGNINPSGETYGLRLNYRFAENFSLEYERSHRDSGIHSPELRPTVYLYQQFTADRVKLVRYF